MPDIKTRDVVSGTIKTIDRSALAGQRMKDAYVQAKDKAEHSVYSSESTSEEYASERITDGVSTVARESVHQVDVQGHRIIHGEQKQIAKHQEIRQSQQAAPENPQPPPNTPRTEQNAPNAQRPTEYLPMGLFPLVWADIPKLVLALRSQSRKRFVISKLLLPKRN